MSHGEILSVKIVVIPQGFTIRDYIDLTLMITAYHHRDRGFDVKCLGEYVEFTGDADDVCRSFATAYKRILEIVEAKLKRGIPCPKMHFNDRNVLAKVFNKLGLPRPPKDARYIDVFRDIIEYFSRELEDGEKCRQFISEISTSTFTRDKVLLLGSKSSKEVFAPLQPFKIEKYEYGKDFLDLAKSKMDVKTTPSWISLIASGWVLSFNGFANGVLLFSMPPSHVVYSSICSMEYTQSIMDSLGVKDPMEAFDLNGYYATPLRIGSSTNPTEAYYLLLALTSPQLKNPALVPLRLMRVGFDGRRFTMLEDVVVDLSRLKEFIEFTTKLSNKLRKALEELSRCAIRSYSGVETAYCKEMFGDNAVRMVKILYNAVMGSYDPLYTVYLLSRLSPEPTETRPYFRDPTVIDELLRALGSIGVEEQY